MPDSQPYITHIRPHRWLLLIVFAVLITNLAQWLLSYYFIRGNPLTLYETKQLAERLQQQNLQLLQQNHQLTAQIHDQSQLLAMNEVASKQLRADMEQLHKKNLVLTKELQFYQNITQNTGSGKTQIRELQLHASGQHGVFYYRIVIARGEKVSQPLTGTITVSLTLPDKTSRQINTHPLYLRQVQVLGGTVRLEEDESPDGLIVKLKQGKKTLTTRSFLWETAPSVEM